MLLSTPNYNVQVSTITVVCMHADWLYISTFYGEKWAPTKREIIVVLWDQRWLRCDPFAYRTCTSTWGLLRGCGEWRNNADSELLDLFFSATGAGFHFVACCWFFWGASVTLGSDSWGVRCFSWSVNTWLVCVLVLESKFRIPFLISHARCFT